ncbi:CAP domain-containing protein [Streptomyces sp. NPDC046727]|uniref:CAP domain-containing protein n=1 Tax=Streptomyces sp. NPDC046727 TaxID=3155373 RepID=UPI0033EAF0FD
MGRHRRSAAGRAAKGRATGVTDTQRSGAGSGDARHSSAGERPIPMGIAPYLNPEAYAEADAKAQAYLFATDHDGAPATPGSSPSSSGSGSGSAGGGFTPADGPSADRPRRGKAARPVRMGLLGVSVAVALGTIAVATGVVPGLENYQLGGSTHTTGGERPQVADSPGNTASEQGGTSGSAHSGPTGSSTSGTVGGSAGRGDSPSPSASTAASASSSASASASASKSASPKPTPTKTASPKPAPTKTAPSRTAPSKPAPSKTAAKKPAPRLTPSTPSTPTTPSKPSKSAEPAEPKATPSRTATKAPAPSSSPVTVSKEAAAEAEVLKLVNDERAKAGCSPLAANSSLTGLAETFSDDMAARGFFDHTDPDGNSPWDRAAKAGITDLGGENIARGQADAAAVMAAWMNSPGHRANILSCNFKTLGVGVHFGPGGPWWTQDFGY